MLTVFGMFFFGGTFTAEPSTAGPVASRLRNWGAILNITLYQLIDDLILVHTALQCNIFISQFPQVRSLWRVKSRCSIPSAAVMWHRQAGAACSILLYLSVLSWYGVDEDGNRIKGTACGPAYG